eukprot:EG_transcript_28520
MSQASTFLRFSASASFHGRRGSSVAAAHAPFQSPARLGNFLTGRPRQAPTGPSSPRITKYQRTGTLRFKVTGLTPPASRAKKAGKPSPALSPRPGVGRQKLTPIPKDKVAELSDVRRASGVVFEPSGPHPEAVTFGRPRSASAFDPCPLPNVPSFPTANRAA